MFTTANRTTRTACLSFAILTAIAINGAMLLTFDGVATDAFTAQCINSGNVAILDTVTIVGRRT